MISSISTGVGKQAPQGVKVRAKITACDPSQRLIHAQLRDGGSIAVAVWEVPDAFRWPQVGEVWTIRRENLFWILGERLNVDEWEGLPITTISGTQMRLDGGQIFNNGGFQICMGVSGSITLSNPVTSGSVNIYGGFGNPPTNLGQNGDFYFAAFGALGSIFHRRNENWQAITP